MAYRRDEMWSEGRYEYERLPRERLPPRIHPDDDYHRVVNIVPKKPPLLDRPGEGSYSRYDDYGHVDYRDYDEGRSFAHERRSGPPHRGEDSGYRWPREDHPASRQPEYRDIRDGFRRKSFYPSHYIRERSPHKRDSPFFRESPVNRRDSPHSRSGSSVSSRSYSPERSKVYPFHQSQHSRSMSSLHKRNISSQQGKERPSGQSLKTSRDASPSGSTAVPSSKALEKSSRLSEKELAEAASKWAAEKAENADESNLPEITEYDVYRQDCETFGMVVKMLIDKDPSLEKSIQFALRQNLHEIGERCIEELKHFIAEYDAANQELSESFKEGQY
ncbi:periphilin-1 isoform X3 [Alligator mississippiensis]|uniref:Periphilin-1 isoform X3 n=1 Tax=Alligator sinensis TaxID=38654 RepID=A0A3Q0GW61_ALLSI|nr:periphilin-1 isoform X3 [Alligator sinensis]XP_059582006.1 periphilin-1 isoform X3 [Alligator mississippiensis]